MDELSFDTGDAITIVSKGVQCSICGPVLCGGWVCGCVGEGGRAGVGVRCNCYVCMYLQGERKSVKSALFQQALAKDLDSQMFCQLAAALFSDVVA